MKSALTRCYIPKMDREVTFLWVNALEIGRNWALGNDGKKVKAAVGE